MVLLKGNSQPFGNENLQEILFKFKEPDCILYSEDGGKIEIHKEIFCQTKFMLDILFNASNFCCDNNLRKIEIICPCSTEDLNCIVSFLYNGKIPYKRKIEISRFRFKSLYNAYPGAEQTNGFSPACNR